jgi:hypothetical protein
MKPRFSIYHLSLTICHHGAAVGTCLARSGFRDTAASVRAQQWKMINDKWKISLLRLLRYETHGRKNTFSAPFLPARSIAYTPRASGYSSLIKLSISIAPFFNRSRAG